MEQLPPINMEPHKLTYNFSINETREAVVSGKRGSGGTTFYL